MTELERFAALLIGEWHGSGGREGGPITVGALLDDILPYRVARRYLPLDAAEDYEALVLKLVAEEGGLATTSPIEAAEMARTTLDESIPDLDVLQLLRNAVVTLTEDSLYRLEGVRPLPAVNSPEEASGAVDDSVEERVLPMRRAADRTAAAREDAPPHIEQVEFIPPGSACWSCGAALPDGRRVSFCVQCGADQRVPTCPGCGTEVERSWRFCPDCGGPLGN